MKEYSHKLQVTSCKSRIGCRGLWVFVLCTLYFVQLNAQDTLKTDHIYIIKEFNPIISSEGVKISTIPQMIKTDVKKLPVQYSFLNKEFKVTFNPEVIQAANMKKESQDKLYKGYVKGGVGTYLTTLLNGYYSTTRSSKQMGSIQLHHLGSIATIKDKGYAGYSDNEIAFFGKKFMPNYTLAGDVKYSYNRFHYYGYDPVFFTDFNKKNTLQSYSSPFFKFSIGNRDIVKDSAAKTYNISLDYRYLSDLLKGKESNLRYFGDYYFPTKKDQIKLSTGIDYNSFKSDTSAAINNAIIFAQPQLITKISDFYVNIGVGLFLDAGTTSSFSFKPIAEVKYPLFNSILVPYAGINGSIKRNNLRSLSQENLFVYSPLLVLKNSNIKSVIYGGLRSSLSQNLNLDIWGKNEIIQNMPLFVNDSLGIVNNLFQVIYDQLNITSFHAELNYRKGQNLQLFLKGQYFIYKTTNELSAWNLPDFKITLTGNYDLYNKIILYADVYYVSSRFAKLYGYANGHALPDKIRIEDLKGYFDLNIGAEYRYTHKIGIFLNVNNAITKQYQRWYNYPVQSINVVGGVKMLF